MLDFETTVSSRSYMDEGCDMFEETSLDEMNRKKKMKLIFPFVKTSLCVC